MTNEAFKNKIAEIMGPRPKSILVRGPQDRGFNPPKGCPDCGQAKHSQWELPDRTVAYCQPKTI